MDGLSARSFARLRRPCAHLPLWGTLGLLVLASNTYAQRGAENVFLQQQRARDDEVRAALDRELPADQKVDWDYGGWYSFFLYMWDDGINSSRTYRRNDLRMWSSLSADQGAHQVYTRFKLQYNDFNAGDSYDRNEDDLYGPNLDRGFYQFDLRNAARAYARENLDWNLKVKVGRDLVEFGTGYALSLPMDHVLATLETEAVEVIGLAGTSIRSTDDIDTTRPDAGDMERNFWGTQITYTGIDKHRPFVYGFWNEDQNNRGRPVLFQKFKYDSWYLGTGSTGEFFHPLLRYRSELVFEGGKSYGNGDWLERSTVDAWAMDNALEYISKKRMKPRAIIEHMFASGDADRTFSPTNAIGGNMSGRDRSFVGFGYRDTGLAFAPRLSNIHIWRAGGSFTPFDNIAALSDLEFGTDWFLYCKNHGNGALSDATANRSSNYAGWEMDYYMNYRVTSDLAWTARLGTFFPGSAFSDQTTRTFFLVGLTWSF